MFIVFLFSLVSLIVFFFLFFFHDTATTEIYTLSLHDALPIRPRETRVRARSAREGSGTSEAPGPKPDRKSTRLNSSHVSISYAVFCLKKKNNTHSMFPFYKKKKKS